MSLLSKLFGTVTDKELKRVQPIAQQVLGLESTYAGCTDDELRGMTEKFKAELAAGKTLDDILPDAFAVCREAAWRVLKMKHFPVQVIGGIVLHAGNIAEMKTGEGKTLVATLPCYLNALAGKGVHIVTVNEYLAERDSNWMGRVYSFLGLSVGLIVAGMSHEQRKLAYNADITYGTSNEFGFDYLRDNMARSLEEKVQRKHPYAIIDEIDSILIDEARTPLIISGPGERATDIYKQADRFARGLKMHKVVEADSKVELEELGGDYIVDERARTVTLTQSGIEKAQVFFNVKNLQDPENLTLSHHIDQAIRARGMMRNGTDYVVSNGEVLIVDEHTGRLMVGRRFSNGLHQAIEAKENVQVQQEDKTYATITLQNFFRKYEKLSGMTGTAMTEADEFLEIYKLNVIEIPTNKPMVRLDRDDVLYRSRKGKLEAIIQNIIACHQKGQPVLVGTVSVEKSEEISRMLNNRGIKHEILNAKNHLREAYVVAQAGTFGAVTIATNMAGRGTDIVLGGNPEFMARNELVKKRCSEQLIEQVVNYSVTDDAKVLELRDFYRGCIESYTKSFAENAEKVKQAGGLFILGTERHESRRIDNQLRGRAGRQGDPGESRFYLSLEDDLMRIFGGERIDAMMATLKVGDDMPLELKLFSNVIESSQKKVEGRNFSIRKNVLSYDDVMNAQREIIYAQRDMVLEGADIKEKILGMIDDSIDNNVSAYLAADASPEHWNLAGLRSFYFGLLTNADDFDYSEDELSSVTSDEIKQLLTERAHKLYEEKERDMTPQLMRVFERAVLLRAVDKNWMEHIDAMDELRRGIGLRSFAQKDPVVEYRMEGYSMFDAMVENIREDAAKLALMANFTPVNEQQRPMKQNATSGRLRPESRPKRTVVKDEKIGRNDPCPCGSGLKYKRCCGRNEK